jgi:hypothetical protein
MFGLFFDETLQFLKVMLYHLSPIVQFLKILAVIISFIIITTSALNWFIKYGVVSVTVCGD